MTDTSLPRPLIEAIAQSVLDTFASLPPKGKPRTRSNGAKEWTVLAGFCLYTCDSQDRSAIECVSIGTGVKVLPHSKLPRHGDVLHDSHGEVVARRGLVRYLLGQLEAAAKEDDSTCLTRGSDGRWRLKDELRLGMYVSTLPCGDASTYTLALAAPPSPPLAPTTNRKPAPLSSTRQAATLGMHTSRASPSDEDSAPQVHRGRVGYSASPGTLRTKPGRLDSPPTTSHSCSDKLALWSLVGIQGALLAAIGVERMLISALVVGGVPAVERSRVEEEIRRAVGGRLGSWEHEGWGTVMPRIGLCDAVFESDRELVGALEEIVSAAENVSFVLGEGVEIICNGTRMGGKLSRAEGEALGRLTRSRVSKLGLLQRWHGVAPSLGVDVPSTTSYFDLKHSNLASQYQSVKQRCRAPGGPLDGWLVTGAEYESFDGSGRLTPSSSGPQ